MKQFITEAKRMQKLAGITNENQLNEITNNQILQFVKLVDPEGENFIRTYFGNSNNYSIEDAIDYLASHSALYSNSDSDIEDTEGGLSGFTKSDLIQHAARAGWDKDSIEYMLSLSPVKYLERG